MTSQALFSLDLNLCTGCSACAIACRTENDVGDGVSWRQIHTFNEARLPGAAVFHYSMACNHCAEPACMIGCPADAYVKDGPWGVVRLEPDRCIGCRYCSWVCPYDAPQYNPSTGLMEKCTFCSHRLDEGGEPACVVACPVGALGFVRSGEPGPIRHPGLPELGLAPGLSLVAKRFAAAAPEMTAEAPAAFPFTESKAKGGPGTEWSLLVFTYGATCLVAWAGAHGLGRVAFHGPLFLLAGVVALGISTLHLGRPARAWRAVLNLRRSWVSREIFFFSAFFLAALVVFWRGPPGAFLGWPVTALGFAALFSMDMVYRVPGGPSGAFPHSAMTTFSAVLLTGLLLQDPWVFAPAAIVKLTLYVARLTRDGEWRRGTAALRISTGFVWPFAVWLAAPTPTPGWLVAGPLIGEALDRAQFYAELGFPSPGRQIELDLRSFLDRPTRNRRSLTTPHSSRAQVADGGTARYPP